MPYGLTDREMLPKSNKVNKVYNYKQDLQDSLFIESYKSLFMNIYYFYLLCFCFGKYFLCLVDHKASRDIKLSKPLNNFLRNFFLHLLSFNAHSFRGLLSIIVSSCHHSKPLKKVKKWLKDFPGAPGIQTWPFKAGLWVQSLVQELSSHMPPNQNTKA